MSIMLDGGRLAPPVNSSSSDASAPPAPASTKSLPPKQDLQHQIDALVQTGLSREAAANAVAAQYGEKPADLKALGVQTDTAPDTPQNGGQTGAPFAGTVAGQDAPFGISQTNLASGETPWQLYEHSPLVDPHDPSQFLKELAASSSLDPHAFDSRPGNSPDAAHHLPINTTVTILDSKRLGMLEQQRKALASLSGLDAMPPNEWRNKYTDNELSGMLAPLRKSIADELTYAGQNMPDPTSHIEMLAAPIAARAPDSHAFREALSFAKQDALAAWKSQGRTPDGLGVLVRDQSKHDTAALTRDATQQLQAAAETAWRQSGGDANAVRAAVAARGGCYASYLDASAAPVIKQAAGTVLQTVLTDEPVQRVIAASHRSPAAAVVQLSKEVSLAINPATNAPYKTSGQIAQILNDPRVVTIEKQFVDAAYKYAGGGNVGMNEATMSNSDFSSGLDALCQLSQDGLTSDALAPANSAQIRGQGPTGKSAVDALAAYISSKRGGASLLGGSMTSCVSHGNAALPAAIAAAEVHAGRDPGSTDDPSQTSVMNAIRFGLDNYTRDVLKPLQSRIAKDDIPLAAGRSEWGGLLTSGPKANAGTLQDIQQKLMTPAVVKDIGDQTQATVTLRAIQNVLDKYPEIHGSTGYKTDAPDLSFYPVTPSKNVVDALHRAIDTATSGHPEQMASKVPFTQFWWLSRTIVSGAAFAAEELGHAAQQNGNLSSTTKQFLAFLVGRPAPAPDAAAPPPSVMEGVGTRGATGVMSALWAFNAAYVIGTAPDSSTKPLEADNIAFGVNQLYFSVTELANFINPNWKKDFFGTVRTQAGATQADTPTRALLDMIRRGIDDSKLPSGLGTSLKVAAGSVLGDTADFAYFVSTVAGIVALAHAPGDNLGSQIAYGGGAFAALTFLGKAGSQMAGEFGTETAAELAGRTLLGLSADGWTGVGVVVNLLAAAVQFGVGLHDAAHSLDADRAWLNAQGVPDKISDPLTRHMTTIEGGTSAGPFITAYFRQKGKSNEDMIAWMKTISDPDEADRIATFAKKQSVGKAGDGTPTIGKDQMQAFEQFLAESPDDQEATLHPMPRWVK